MDELTLFLDNTELLLHERMGYVYILQNQLRNDETTLDIFSNWHGDDCRARNLIPLTAFRSDEQECLKKNVMRLATERLFLLTTIGIE